MSPLPFWLRAKAAILTLFLLGALGWRSCTEQPAPSPAYAISSPPRSTGAGVLPVAIRLPFPSGRWLRVLDTVRAGGPAHLLRKATPRSQWLPAQPAYLPKLHRRPRQWLLDSLAQASMRRA
ncbi:MAG: hypothetical protein ACRYFX_12735 [Janthinobacterium lividum]